MLVLVYSIVLKYLLGSLLVQLLLIEMFIALIEVKKLSAVDL